MLPAEALIASQKFLAEELLESYERERALVDALKLAAGVRHDMDDHHSIYAECKIGGCIRERALLAEHGIG
jgi:hypothetical protein